MRRRFDRTAIRRGLQVFFALSLASIAVVFLFADAGAAVRALGDVRPGYIVAAFGIAVADWFGGGLRLYLLTRGFERHPSLWTSIQAALANVAMGAVTPSQMGSGPAQVFILHRSGMGLVEAMSASLVTFVVTVLFFVLAAGAMVLLGVDAAPDSAAVRHLLRYGVRAFMLIGGAFIVFVARPGLLRGLLRGVFNFLSRFRSRHFLRPTGRATRLMAAIDEIHAINRDYIRRRSAVLAVAFVLTALLFGSKCVAAYLIVRGLGVDAGLWHVASIQILVLLAVYFFPTPGGTGAAELGSAVLMADVVPVELLPVYVILWRLVVNYLAVGIGAIMMLRVLGRGSLEVPRRPYEAGTVEKKIAVSGERA